LRSFAPSSKRTTDRFLQQINHPAARFSRSGFRPRAVDQLRPDTRGHAALAPQQGAAIGFLDLYQKNDLASD
jgi:hypothetical protein